MVYEFKGFSWGELAECWGITVEEQPMNVIGIDDEPELKEIFKTKEEIEVTKYINGMKMVYTVDDEEEVLAEKIKNHIQSNLDSSGKGFKDKQMRKDLDSFLHALINEEEKLGYNAPVFKGLLEVEDDKSFAKWICHNLERLWT